MAEKKYSLGKKEMSMEEFADMQNYPYKDARGRRFSSEELKTFTPPGGKLTNVGAGSPEYGGYEAGAGRGRIGGMTAAQAAAKYAREESDQGKYKNISERLQDIEITKQAEADDAAQKALLNKYAKGGKVSSASKRADGCAIRGKTRGKMV